MSKWKKINMAFLTASICAGHVAWKLFEKKHGVENEDILTRLIGDSVFIASAYFGTALGLFGTEAYIYQKEHKDK